MDTPPDRLPKYPPIAWSATPLLGPALALLAGVGAARAAGFPDGAGWLFLVFGVWGVALAFNGMGRRISTGWPSVGRALLLLAIFSFGFVYAGWRHGPNQADYFAHLVGENDLIAATVTGIRPTARRLQVQLSVEGIVDTTEQWRSASGRTMAYLLPDERGAAIAPGDRLLLAARVSPIEGPLNPAATDFRSYWAGQGIFHQLWLKEEDAYRRQSTPVGFNWREWGDGARDAWLKTMRKALDGDALAVAAALVLGKKDLLTSDVKSAYADTGAIHVLAVSGLHVGIVAGLILWLLGWWRPRGLAGRLTKAAFVLGAIWAFAVVTGLSPSVQRAAVMFSVLTLGGVLRRRAGLFNLLSLAAILMVVWEPRQLFQVGFQLSFLAVAGIGLFARPLLDLCRTGYAWVAKIWSALVVSTAAQLGTLPLSLHYFGRFPLYFLLSGTLVVVFAVAVLCLGITHGVIAGLLEVPLLSEWVGGLLRFVVEIQNAFIHFFGGLPGGVLEVTGVHAPVVVALTVLLLLLAHWLYYRQLNVRFWLLAGLIGLATYGGHRALHREAGVSGVLYHLPRGVLLDVFRAGTVHPIAPAGDPTATERAAGGLRRERGVNVAAPASPFATDTLLAPGIVVSYPLVEIAGRRILVLDGGREHALLDRLPPVEAVWAINGFRPGRLPPPTAGSRPTIVVDGSSPRYRWEEWERTAEAAGLPLHLTGREGAWVLPASE